MPCNPVQFRKLAFMAGKSSHAPDQRTVFLFDVDNTLLNNDRVTDDLKRYLKNKWGRSASSTTGIF